MLPIKKEHMQYLHSRNITVREFKPEMSQPRKVIHLPKIRMVRGRASGIRITNVHTVKPPDPELVKQQEENRLRAQLQKEIVSRSRSCSNKSYECFLPVVTGRQFCARHILQDPSAPYKQCGHTGGGARCPLPAPAPPVGSEPRDQRDQGLCYQHARSAAAARARSSAPPPPVATTETLLHQLTHYVRNERTRTTSCASAVSVVSEPEVDTTAPEAADPFKQIDATAVNAAYSTSIMECCSASDSDADSLTAGPEYEEALSDYEDSTVEDGPLWRAGVYTAEEAVSEAKNALVSLQSAYIRQMSHLRCLLQTARLKYLRELKAEKELYCSINAQARSGPLTVRERRQLRKLKCYAGYHRKHGHDAVLARKLQRKRAKVNLVANRPVPSHARCTFAEGSMRCANNVVPAAKHCLKHIMHDRHQVLFAACGDARGLSACGEARARLPLPAAACRHHAMPPTYTVFTLKKDETDSDDSRSSEA
ncbi:KAT8 regulatory NSL complex subunit 2 [Cydia pomonella]|uniref:KAT8 regulatory NSL complex subunit 2 n=1 Tax=Cydia pomonella TaxID=82600 RepID=UPI002ADD5541|nr:KAT8 regulatory NSL complex subunit 2 [Cydia pomonella]